MPMPPRQPLHMETAHDDLVLALGCDTCEAIVPLRTTSAFFASLVRGFFERHGRCVSSLDLPV
jgi:hypothetical protein